MINRNKLRRLRLLQWLQRGGGEWLAAPLLLKLLQEDPDLAPDQAVVLRSLIWLEDHDLADVRVFDADDAAEAVTFARITPWGLDFLAADVGIEPGIYHPAELLEVVDG